MDTSSSHNQIEYNSSTDIVFISLPANPGRNGSDNIVSYNKISYTPLSTPKLIGIILRGDRNLIEHNDIGFGAGDCMELGGANIVVRNNVCHDKNGRADFWGSNVEHIDFAQAVGGVSPTVSFSLFENNTEKNCTNDQNNCHFIFVRASGGEIADNIIERYNFISSSDSFTGLGDSTDGNATVPNPHVYNNTAVLGALSTSIGDCFTSNAGSGGQNVFLNNICQDANAGVSITYFGQGGLGNGNITYDTTCTTSCTWSAPYTNEATYAALHNKNPLFANYPTDGTLQVGSPAIGAGVALTTASGAGTNSTSLTVADAHFFQPGWGPSDNKVQADWIRIGASTTAQISSVNYLTNVITLANPVSWNNNDPVHLYKNSSGDVVLNGANPNIGASVVSTNVSGAPTPPTGLLASVQ